MLLAFDEWHRILNCYNCYNVVRKLLETFVHFSVNRNVCLFVYYFFFFFSTYRIICFSFNEVGHQITLSTCSCSVQH